MADPLVLLHSSTIAPGLRAASAEVKANFNQLITRSNLHETRVTSAEASITSYGTRLDTNEAAIVVLENLWSSGSLESHDVADGDFVIPVDFDYGVLSCYGTHGSQRTISLPDPATLTQGRPLVILYYVAGVNLKISGTYVTWGVDIVIDSPGAATFVVGNARDTTAPLWHLVSIRNEAT